MAVKITNFAHRTTVDNGASSDIVEPLQEQEMLYKPFPNGESYDDVKARVADFLEFLKQDYVG